MRWGIAVVAFLIVAAGCSAPRQDRAAFVPPEGKYDARILRDDFGIPHVYGKTDADAAYGLAFAHCEDDAENMEDAVSAARAQLGSIRGKDFAKFDYIMHLFRVRELVQQNYEKDLSPEVRAICEAYADGINHFAAVYPERMPNITLPVTGPEIVMGFTLKAPFFYELHTQLERIMNLKETPELQEKNEQLAWLTEENVITRGIPIGSNSWAVAPGRSSDGHTRLAVNSHQPWDGPVAWYQAHVHSEEGWDMRGGTFPGGPMIFSGHDTNKGWCHTVNRPDLADVYLLKINPKNKNQYEFDGEWKDLEVRNAPLKVRLWGSFSWTVNKECLWSIHGPAIRTDAGVFAFRFAGLGEVKMVEQWFRMNKAKNFDEFYAAMEIQGVPSFNVMYADKTGKLFYAYNGKFPRRAPGYDYKRVLPGHTSDTLWTEFLPFSAVPQMQDAQSGFIQTCNSTPFISTDGPDNPRAEDFAPEMGIEEYVSNRTLRALALYGKDESITPEEFHTYKHDTEYTAESVPAKRREEMLKLDPADPLAKEAIEVLRAWNLRTDKDNTSAALGYLACVPPERAGNALGMKPRTFHDDPLHQLTYSAHYLKEHFGTLTPAWGDFCRLRRGSVDVPLSGGPDTLRALNGTLQKDGRLAANYGDGLYMFVEWGPDGAVRSQAIHNYGAASTDPGSPHYDDQAKMFAEETLREEPMTEEALRERLSLEYRPGEFADAWYKHVK